MPPMAIVAATALGSKLPSHRSIGAKQSQAERSTVNGPLEAEHRLLPFTKSQLCLALNILRSKPADANTREYCLQLQKHVKQMRPTADGEHRYIDTAEFWKDQYSKVHSENKVMEARLAQLEVLTDENRSDGRAVTFELCSLSMTLDRQPDTLLGDAGSTNNLPLLKQALVLHRLLRDDKVPTDMLTSALQSSLSYMNSTMNEACNINGKRTDRTGESTNHTSLRTFNVVAAIFNICVKGLAHLCRDIPGRRCRGQVIFSLVQFFVNALGRLHNTCLRRTVYQAPNISNHQDEDSHRANNEDRARTLTSGLTKFLVNILTCPELQKAHFSYIEVLEGMFSALLEEVGGLISQVIFDEHLPTLRGPLPVSKLDKNASASINALAMDLKCQHLAFILKRAMEDRSEKDRHSLAAMLAGTKVLGIGAGKKVVLARAKQRLQETLLKGIFGDDGEQFMNALQMPESEESWGNEAPQVVRDEKESFVESVWSTVGWDMMSNN